ncbi:DNA cytosine methyltransferase [Celeribacter sp.]|uniref:DNA cytosine methyltransferase n=1 Tax=Alphaproteobacteria TaxID=28211 RepID=UPI003A945BAA
MKVVDLFAGCGGLALGFKAKGMKSVAFVEWEKSCCDTLLANFVEPVNGIDPSVFQVDIRNYEAYLDDGASSLTSVVRQHGGIDGIIGGPPCQAYSMAGRVRDPNGMRNDYRNYLFEAYCHVLSVLAPSFFVFENVVGMLSAKPNGVPIAEEIEHEFSKAGYYIGKIDKRLSYDFADFGGPQHRKRVIIFGVRTDIAKHVEKVERFHRFMRESKKSFGTVGQAIGDLPALVPFSPDERPKSRISHQSCGTDPLHRPRFHNARDIETFKLLAEDAISDAPKYKSVEALKKLYEERVGKKSAVHKYHVLNRDAPSNLIPAHLHKDGLRHIHPDPNQARSITLREAARLQSFPDDFKFCGSMGDIYKMIGNAVAPQFGAIIATSVATAMQS